jgi:MOSC domain-containing protein YiiM
MEIDSLNVALPSTQRYGNREVFTGGAKSPVPQAMLRASGFEGDGQGVRRNHGGPDKAVCVYPSVHYPHWQRMLGRRLDPGAFSENLTVSGIREARVCVGDVFRTGEAVVQVSTPRTPCDKVAGKNGEKQLPKWISGSGYTGFYMRVLEEGWVETGDAFERVERHPDGINHRPGQRRPLPPVPGPRPDRTPHRPPGVWGRLARDVRETVRAAAARTGRAMVSSTGSLPWA